MPKPIIASDYAILQAGAFEFYYGYEQEENGEWAFVAKKGNRELMRLGWSQLKSGEEQFSVEQNLLAGLGIFITNHAQVREYERGGSTLTLFANERKALHVSHQACKWIAANYNDETLGIAIEVRDSIERLLKLLPAAETNSKGE